MFKKSYLKAMVVATTLTLLSSHVYAGTASANQAMSATVANTCAITAGTLAFGTIDPTLNTNVDSTASFNVTCTSGAAWSIGLDNGLNVSVNQRRAKVASLANFVNYNLFSDSARTVAWTGAAPVTGTGNGSSQAQTIYARVPSGQQSTVAGAYVDTVTATVTF